MASGGGPEESRGAAAILEFALPVHQRPARYPQGRALDLHGPRVSVEHQLRQLAAPRLLVAVEMKRVVVAAHEIGRHPVLRQDARRRVDFDCAFVETLQ